MDWVPHLSERGWELRRRGQPLGLLHQPQLTKLWVPGFGAEARLCPEQLAEEAVPRPGPVWPLNIWCESKAFPARRGMLPSGVWERAWQGKHCLN